LETDARHNFEIWDNEVDDTIIYSNINMLHAYGHLEEKMNILENNGYTKVESITGPKGYGIFCYTENDTIEKELIDNYKWNVKSVKIHDPKRSDNDCDEEIEKKPLFDCMFDYLEKETL